MRRIESSFQDPAGYMFEYDEELFRAVNQSYKPDYDHLLSSGLYQKLVDLGLIVSFEEVDPSSFCIPGLYKVLKPLRVNFISYPYEWAFDMLKDAALLTLKIQKIALEYGMSLKDASAFNIQFRNGKPIFIDTLSFELYPTNQPWVAYRQFCQHFLSPLAVMANVEIGLNRLFIIYIDGIPLNIATRMLPWKCRFSLGLFLHIYLHSRAQKKYEIHNGQIANKDRKFTLASMKVLIDSLKTTVEKQRWNSGGTEWSNYNENGVHKKEYVEFKTKLISDWLDVLKPNVIWDLGSNDGYYSRIAEKKGIDVISYDLDHACLNMNYVLNRQNEESKILPLFLDLLNPSPSLGWRGTERSSFYNRNKPDLVMALALIHHLVISGNIPLDSIAFDFSRLAEYLIIEFIPLEDEKVKILLQKRKNYFSEYNQNQFERIFSKYYLIEKRELSFCNSRIFYLMKIK